MSYRLALIAVLGMFTIAAEPPSAIAADKDALADRLSALPAQLGKSKSTDPQVARTLYGEALKRVPTDKEIELIAAHLLKAKDREAAIRDVLWAIVNSKEFMKVHDCTIAEAMKISEKVTNPKAKG